MTKQEHRCKKTMKTMALSLLFILSIICTSSMLAQRKTFNIDPNASAVKFRLGDSRHSVHGTFHLEAGVIQFNQGSPDISGFVVIAAETGKTSNSGRDKKMIAEILDVPEFTNILFVPKSYRGTITSSGDSDIQLIGIFTLRGTPHDLAIPMQMHIDGTTCIARTHFTIPYVKWGLKDPRIFIFRAAKEVQIDITLVGNLSPANGL
jgi:polyisoprenoid-binding protein YceI